MTTPPGYPAVPLSGETASSGNPPAGTAWVRVMADRINNMLRGRLNVTLALTLTANAASTTITDARLGFFSAILFSPLTANAAAAIGTTYVSSQNNGSAVITHANNAQTDRSFTLVIVG